MSGEWIWILLALFGIFRLLALAGKKKEGPAAPVPPGPGPTPPPPLREEVDELKLFIDSLTGRVEAGLRGRPPAPPRERGMPSFSPPPPRPAPRPQAPAPRPESASAAPLHRAAPPPERVVGTVPGFFSFPVHPVVQGIIFSEILGPPRGLGGGAHLPSDLDRI